MIGPRSIGRSLGRLLPPPVRRNDVRASVAVDVPDADSMLRHYPVARLRNLMDDPWLGRSLGIGCGPANRAPAYENDIRLAIAVDILEDGDFRGDSRQDVVLIPPAQLTPRVDVK